MLKDDEIIAAYIREKKPELLDTLSFTIYKAVKSLADSLRKMSTVEIETALSDMEEMESEKENNMNDFMISRNTFLDALVLDVDGKTDIVQVTQALEKAVVENEED